MVLGLVVAVMAMGAGYAAWTDQLNINTTVSTGQLDVQFVDRADTELTLAQHVTGDVTYPIDAQGEYDQANVVLSNLYPGATANVSLKMQNNSTIPVKMNAIQDVRSANWGPNGQNFDQIGACVRFFDANGTALVTDNTTTYANPWEPAHLQNVQLPVGGYAIIDFTFTASDSIGENDTFTFNPSAVFKQFNK